MKIPMSATPPTLDARELRAQLLHHDEQEHTAGVKELADLDAIIAATKLKIEQLTLEISKSALLRSELARRNDGLRERVMEGTRIVRPFQCCPAEVLGVIFTHAAEEPDDHWVTLGHGFYNKSRAMRPFIVAAVCQLWRSAAMTTAQIWDYAGVPNLSKHSKLAQPTLSRIRTVLEKSGTTPLDVLFEQIDELAPYTEILDLLYPELYRWRACELYATDHMPGLLAYLRGPAPQLKALYVSQADDESSRPLDDSESLSCTTLLQRLISKSTGLLPQTCAGLLHLEIEVSPSTPVELWTFLRTATRLVSLDIKSRSGVSALGVRLNTSIRLASLQSLALRQHAPCILVLQPDLFIVPNLNLLVIDREWSGDTGDRLDDIAEFLRITRSARSSHIAFQLTISSATLRSDEAQFMLTHEIFRFITSLTLNECRIDSAFWSGLRLASPEALSGISTYSLQSIDMKEASLESFLKFARWMRRRDSNGKVSKIILHECKGLTTRDKVELDMINGATWLES